MKFSKLATHAFVMMALTCGALNSAQATTQVSKSDINALVQTCNTDPNQFEASLGRIRDGLTLDVQNMSQTEYDEMLDANDSRLILAISTWPEILKEKDEMYKAYGECADYHTEARKALNSVSETRANKKEAILALSDCLMDRYRKPVAPMTGLLACYKKQAAQAK